jgi:hypothetical protein
MNSSCFVKSLCLAAAAAWTAHADFMPPDSHLVPRTVTLINTGDYPGLAFAALEFYPGDRTTPVATTRMGAGVQAKITGYKLDYIEFYSAKAADWPAAKAAQVGSATALCATPMVDTTKAGCVCCHPDPTPAPSPSAMTLIQGNVDAGSQYVPNTSKLISEAYEYQLEGTSAEKITLHAILQTYADGSKQEVPPGATALRAPVAAAPMARLAADGRALIWVPQRSGIAAVSLFDAGGRRAWSQRRVAASGQAQVLALPAMAAGRYLVSAQGRGWAQSAWLDLGKR